MACCASWNAGLVNAQPAIDPASELIRQQERQREQRSHQEPAVDVHLAGESPASPERLPLNETPCFKIQLIAIDLAPSADTEKFLWLPEALAGANHDDAPIGKCLGSQGIAMVVRRAQDALSAQGFVTSRVIAKPQDLSGGTLTLSVVPGRVRAIRFAEQAPPAFLPRAALWNNAATRSGAILTLNDIEQSLENLRRVPTVEADIRIEPADAPDQSDLVITQRQKFPLRLAVLADDSGTKATGKYQGSATLSLDNLLSLSDLFYVTINNDLGGGHPGSRGTNGQTVHYSLPLGYWSVGLTHSNNSYYQNVAGLNQSYLYRGTSETTELSLSRIVRRDTSSKTTLALKAFQRRSNNYIDDTEVMTQRRVTGGYELALGHKQTLQTALTKDPGKESPSDPAKVQVNLSYKRGTGDFDTLPAPEELSGEGTSRFGLLLLDASLDIPFKAAGQSWAYSVALKVQNNTTPLTPQDRFAIGSRYSVRGFDGESLLSAERGWTVCNELILNLAQSQQLYLGLDYGEVSGPSSDLLVGRTLSGAAIGWRGNWGRLQYDFFIATPLHKPDTFKTASTTGGFQVSLNI